MLAKSDGFQRKFVAWQEKGTQVGNHRTGKGNHHPILVERRSRAEWYGSNRLILRRDGILMTHSRDRTLFWTTTDLEGRSYSISDIIIMSTERTPDARDTRR